MRVWITNGRNSIVLIGAFFAVAAPAHALAAVQVTEVLYDAVGADTGREWIEITDTGQESVDLTGYKLFESGVNHGLTVVQGSSTLAAGESAIIAANTQKFLLDYPTYSGTLFKSSFSLSNTGESFELRDKSLKTAATVSYISSQGAAGDGNSLHLSGSTWAAGAPNPGSIAPTNLVVKTVAAPVPMVKTAVKTSSIKQSSSPSRVARASASGYSAPSVAAVGVALPLQAVPSLWLYISGLVALMVLGVGAVVYARPEISPAKVETAGDREEFELE